MLDEATTDAAAPAPPSDSHSYVSARTCVRSVCTYACIIDMLSFRSVCTHASSASVAFVCSKQLVSLSMQCTHAVPPPLLPRAAGSSSSLPAACASVGAPPAVGLLHSESALWPLREAWWWGWGGSFGEWALDVSFRGPSRTSRSTSASICRVECICQNRPGSLVACYKQACRSPKELSHQREKQEQPSSEARAVAGAAAFV